LVEEVDRKAKLENRSRTNLIETWIREKISSNGVMLVSATPKLDTTEKRMKNPAPPTLPVDTVTPTTTEVESEPPRYKSFMDKPKSEMTPREMREYIRRGGR